jgi:TusA-related sulfurtransferase
MTQVIDGRGMEPPQPLERALQALETLPDGEQLLLLLYCQPHPLYGLLKQRGCNWTESLRADGTREVRIRRPRA